MLRRLLFASIALACAILVQAGRAVPGEPSTAINNRSGDAPPPLGRYDRVDVAPTSTSIYVGVVSMTMPTFTRSGAHYEAAYTAKVIPLFFYNEKGKLTVDISDAQLKQLADNQTVDFTGRAVRDDGVQRNVTGKATPTDKHSGKLKVRVQISKRIELIFNSTYRFAGA